MSITASDPVGASGSGGTTIDIDFTSTPSDGQMIVLILHDRGNIEGTPPSGFTKGPSIASGDYLTLWYKEASSESGTNYEITGLASDQRGLVGFLLDADNGWADTPTGGTGTTYDSSSASEVAAQGTKITGEGATLGVLAASVRLDLGSDTVTYTQDFTQLIKNVGGGSGNYVTGCIATRVFQNDTMAGRHAVDWTTAVTNNRAFVYYFREAPPAKIEQSKSATLDDSTGTTIQATFDSTPTSGNVLAAMYVGGGNWDEAASISGSGWTEVHDASGLDPPYGSVATYYKEAGASEPTAITVTLPNTDSGALFIFEISGIDVDDILEDSDWGENTSTATSFNAAAVTTANGPTFIVAAHFHWNTNGDQNFTHATDWTEEFDVVNDGGAATNEFNAAASSYYANKPGTYTPTFSWTNTSTYGGGVGSILAFNIPGIIQIYPLASADDGHGYPASSFSTSNTTLWFGDDGTETQSYIRYTLPQDLTDATIDAASIAVNAHQASITWTDIFGVDTNDPAAPTSYSQLDGLTHTTEKSTWESNFDAGGGWRITPDLTDVVQELVDTHDVGVTDHIMFHIDPAAQTNTNANEFDSYDSTGPGPLLDIWFTPSSGLTVQTEKTLVRYVGAGADDGHIDGTSFYNTSDKLYWGQWQTSSVQHMFYRFDNMTIPPGARIESAELSLYFITRYSGTDDLDATIYAEDADDPNAFDSYSSGSDPWTGRTDTAASVAWTLDDGGWTDGTWHDSPDLTAIIQEIVDRSGWSSGNAILLYLEDEGPTPVGNEASFGSYETTGDYEAYLTVTYSTRNTLGFFMQLVAG